MGLNNKGNNLGESADCLKQTFPSVSSPFSVPLFITKGTQDVSEREGFYNGTLLVLPQDDETFPVNVSSSGAVSPESQKCT